jgi:hypothetical protein
MNMFQRLPMIHRVGLYSLICVASLCVYFPTAPAQAPASIPGTATPKYIFGVINDLGTHYSEEWSSGVRATNLELHWKYYEPSPGIYDQSYIDHQKQIMTQLKTQGWYVQLVPGYQYTPDWVFATYPNMFYKNQYGERYDPDPILKGDFRVINAPFNPQARSLIAGYIARIFQDFDQTNPKLQFDSVRIGGGVQGELRYPPGEWNGHLNSYWAFDDYAQDPAVSGIPAPVVGWRPGLDASQGSLGRGQLLVNPGFEDGKGEILFTGWSPDEEVTAQAMITGTHSGSRSLSVTTKSMHRMHQFVRVAPGTTYDYGGWIKSKDGVGLGRILITQYNNLYQEVASTSFGKLESKLTSWTEKSGTITASSSTTILKVEVDGDRSGKYYFDDLWLKRANETNTQDRDVEAPQAFLDWYIQSMTNYQNWQITEIRKYYPGQMDLLYAGKGVRPNQITDALTNDLRGDGWSEQSSAIYSGADYDRHINGLANPQNIAVYLTGIDEPPINLVNDSSPYPGEWSAAKWLAFLARERGLPIWGENSGLDTQSNLKLSIDRMRLNGFIGIMWAFESDLYSNAPSYATIADYASFITAYQNIRSYYLPLTISNP